MRSKSSKKLSNSTPQQPKPGLEWETLFCGQAYGSDDSNHAAMLLEAIEAYNKAIEIEKRQTLSPPNMA